MLTATLLLAAACNELYGIEPTEIDQDTARDSDEDGRIDLDDNCPAVANGDQLDFDGDEVGDACDNCQLHSNTLQLNEGEPVSEQDTVGDDCDPNPASGGDCLVLLDFFSDPTQLTVNWELVAANGDPAPTVTHLGDHIVFEPAATNRPAFMLARHEGARLVGRFSVNAVGVWSPTKTFVEGMTAADVTDATQFLACGMQKIDSTLATYIYFQQSSASSTISAGVLSGQPVRTDLSIRLFVDRGTPDVARCSVEWGVADGVASTPSLQAPLPAGGGGIYAKNEAIAVRAIALYETRTSCPSPIVR